jgi:hypothetical protein
MTGHCRAHVRILAVLAVAVALALLSTAFFHSYLHSIDHSRACNPRHHCLLCTVLSSTLFSHIVSDFLPLLPLDNRPLPVMPVPVKEIYVQASAAVRAPPRPGIN